MIEQLFHCHGASNTGVAKLDTIFYLVCDGDSVLVPTVDVDVKVITIVIIINAQLTTNVAIFSDCVCCRSNESIIALVTALVTNISFPAAQQNY